MVAVSDHLVQEISSSRGVLCLIIEIFNKSLKSEKCWVAVRIPDAVSDGSAPPPGSLVSGCLPWRGATCEPM